MIELEPEAYKRIPLEILLDVANFCIKNNIRYSLAYGTLLGAIRHKGYIPWDDDIDIVIPRQDYELFRKIYKSDKYHLVDLLSDKKYNVGVAKICDPSTVYFFKKHFKREIGLFIDVFVIDNIPSSDHERGKWLMELKMLKLYNLLNNTKLKEYLTSSYGWKMKTLAILSKSLPIPSSWVHHKIEKLMRKYENKDCKYVGCPIDIRIDKNKKLFVYLYPKEYFEKFIDVEFENHFFKATAYYDKVLKILYGNYMELPPIEDRKGKHNLIAYYK